MASKSVTVAFSAFISIFSAISAVKASLYAGNELKAQNSHWLEQKQKQDEDDFTNDVFMCYQYRTWQQIWTQKVHEILNDPTKDLTWKEFILIKEGNKVPSLERRCWMIKPFKDSEDTF